MRVKEVITAKGFTATIESIGGFPMIIFFIRRLNILTYLFLLLIITTLTFIGACQDKEMKTKEKNISSINNKQEIEWQKLSEKVIFFGHQSVGQNILDGIKDIAKENPKLNLIITENRDSQQTNAAPLFIDSEIGKNGEPKTKVDAFKDIIGNGMGEKATIAFMKFCYVDFNKDTDVKEIFDYYKNAMRHLKEKYPKTTFVHFTVPVEVKKETWKAWIKNFLGKKDIWEYQNDVPRGLYNNLLKKEYEGKEPIFDLALNESIHPEGKKEFFEYSGIRYPALVPEYTTDGAHLNEKGRKFVANKLLIFLSNLKQ